MTQPTQAQIEALTLGKAGCLIALAFEPISANHSKWKNAVDIIEKQIAALTAAAEVEFGEWRHEHGNIINRTIEECAQVDIEATLAEYEEELTSQQRKLIAHQIAAAIRARKT